MVLTQKTEILARLKVMASRSATFDSKTFERTFNVDQSTQESNSYEDFDDGQVTDKAISFGTVDSPTFVLIFFNSRFNGENGTVEDDHASVTVKIDGGAAVTTDMVLLLTNDPVNDTTTSTITYSTLADTDTVASVFIAGRNS